MQCSKNGHIEFTKKGNDRMSFAIRSIISPHTTLRAAMLENPILRCEASRRAEWAAVIEQVKQCSPELSRMDVVCRAQGEWEIAEFISRNQGPTQGKTWLVYGRQQGVIEAGINLETFNPFSCSTFGFQTLEKEEVQGSMTLAEVAEWLTMKSARAFHEARCANDPFLPYEFNQDVLAECRSRL